MAGKKNDRDQWFREMEASFIEKVKQHTLLYDYEHPLHGKRTSKILTYKGISERMTSEYPEYEHLLTGDGLSRKFCNLRKYYFQELKKTKSIPPEELAEKHPKWPHFDRLSFLADYEPWESVSKPEQDKLKIKITKTTGSQKVKLPVAIDEELIEEVKKYKFLYDFKDPLKSKLSLRISTFDKISKKLSLNHPEFKQFLTCAAIQRRFLQLRKYYIMTAHHASKRNTVSKWKHFERLNFLKDYCPDVVEEHIASYFKKAKSTIAPKKTTDSQAQGKFKTSNSLANKGAERVTLFARNLTTKDPNVSLPIENGQTEDQMLVMRSRADKAVEDLVREKKRSNELKEQLLEESRKRNKYLEALVKINCLQYNQSFEELMKD